MAKTVNRLKALSIDKISKPGWYPDGMGLYLQVSPTGSKSWVYRYERAGKERRHGLGSYPTTGLEAARNAGATGSTVINQARGEGIEKNKTFFGLNLEIQRDAILLLVEEHLSRTILETIAKVGEFEDQPGSGIAFQLDVEDAVGVSHQIRELTSVVEEEL